MSNEAFIEEILFESHQKGIFDELIEKVREIRKEFPHIDRYEAYEIALKTILDSKAKSEN
jgi:hypothetical protein